MPTNAIDNEQTYMNKLGTASFQDVKRLLVFTYDVPAVMMLLLMIMQA